MFDKEKLKQAMNGHGDTNKGACGLPGYDCIQFLDDLERAAAIPAQAHSPDRGPVSTLPTGRVGYILPGRC